MTDPTPRTGEPLSPEERASSDALLHAALDLCAPGGSVTWVTCSLEPEENEDVVAAFVASGAFKPVPPRDLPAAVQPLVNDAGHLRTFPFRDGLEAFFGAILTRAD